MERKKHDYAMHEFYREKMKYVGTFGTGAHNNNK